MMLHPLPSAVVMCVCVCVCVIGFSHFAHTHTHMQCWDLSLSVSKSLLFYSSLLVISIVKWNLSNRDTNGTE